MRFVIHLPTIHGAVRWIVDAPSLEVAMVRIRRRTSGWMQPRYEGGERRVVGSVTI